MNKSFEDQWKDALGDTSQVPPPEIWDRVEKELDKQRKRPFLWKNPVILSGVAAAVVLVLGTLLFVNNAMDEKGQAGMPSVTQQPENGPAKNKEKHAGESKSSSPVSSTKAEKSKEDRSAFPENKHISGRAESPSKRPVRVQGESVPKAINFALNAKKSEAARPGNLTQVAVAENTFDSDLNGQLNDAAIPAAYQLLSTLPLLLELPAYPSHPEVKILQRPAYPRKEEKKMWLGLIAANAPFNPNFSAPGFQQEALMAVQNSHALLYYDKAGPNTSLSDYSNSSRTDAHNSFRPGQSVSFGVTFGRRLKNKLSLESGLKFTRATALLTSNVYAVNKTTGETDSFSYANYLSGGKEETDVLISVSGTSQYSYHFLSIPLLLNYQLLNIGKLNVNAVGGMSCEFLLSGTVINSKHDQNNFNAGNSNFRTANIAGTGGLRISYPITPLLDVNIGGMYQHFLTSGLQRGNDATFRPSMLGMNLGLSVRQ